MAFLARRADITAALERGEPALMIWERLFDTASPPPLTYGHFNKLVRRFIREGDDPVRRKQPRTPGKAASDQPTRAVLNPNPKMEDFE